VDTETTALSPLDYFRPLWRFKWLVLLLVVAAAGATYAYYLHKPKSYSATTQVYVGTSTLQSLLEQASLQNAGTLANDARLVTTPQVAARVATDLHLTGNSSALLSAVTAAASTTSSIIDIGATSGSPTFAAALANGFAKAYLEVTAANQIQQAQTAVNALQHQISSLSGPGNSIKRTALETLLGEVLGQSAVPPQVGTQLAPAAVPASPTSPRPVRNAIFAAALALLLGVIICYVLDRSDKRLRNLDDFERLLGLPVLASIPRVRRTTPPRGDAVSTTAELREPYRNLRVNLDMVRLKAGVRTLMVTSALPGEGKTTVVRNLAIAYCEAGLSVAIIEGDLRRPTLAELFDIDASRGLTDILDGETDLRSVIVNITGAGTAERIDLLPAGRVIENPTARLRPDAFQAVRNQLLSDHAIVLVDSPPILAVSDALVMAGEVDGIVFVVRSGVSTDATSKRLRQTFERMPGVTLLGTVANAVSDELGIDRYRYYYGPDPASDAYKPMVDEHANGAGSFADQPSDPHVRSAEQ